MNIRKEIEDLQEYTLEEKKHNNVFMEKSVQHKFLEGYIGVILNNIDSSESFEVYAYLKDKDIIACPLLLKKFNDIVSATDYYEKIVSLIENNDNDYIINHLKLGLWAKKWPPKRPPKRHENNLVNRLHFWNQSDII